MRTGLFVGLMICAVVSAVQLAAALNDRSLGDAIVWAVFALVFLLYLVIFLKEKGN